MLQTTTPPVRTLYSGGSNARLLQDVTRLYIADGALVADVTWGGGIFWKKTDATRFTLLGSDIDPARIRAAAGVDAPQQHARKTHSYLFVFKLTDSPCLALQGRPRKGSQVREHSVILTSHR
jgi:hypothetical protein